MIQNAGLTVLAPAADFLAGGREGAKSYARDLHAQMEVSLRAHVGQTRPRGETAFSMEGPMDDPSSQSVALQGTPGKVYAFTLQVPIETDDLPADCPAYRALVAPHAL